MSRKSRRYTSSANGILKLDATDGGKWMDMSFRHPVAIRHRRRRLVQLHRTGGCMELLGATTRAVWNLGSIKSQDAEIVAWCKPWEGEDWKALYITLHTHYHSKLWREVHDRICSHLLSFECWRILGDLHGFTVIYYDLLLVSWWEAASCRSLPSPRKRRNLRPMGRVPRSHLRRSCRRPIVGVRSYGIQCTKHEVESKNQQNDKW